MKNFLIKLWNKISAIIFPSDIKCMFCGRDVEKGNVLCDSCQENAPFNSGKRCILCDQPIFGESDVCDFCKTNHKNFDRALSAFIYEKRARNAVICLKSKNAKYLAPKMAKFMAERCLQEDLHFDVIIPVPLSDAALKLRKYNQSALLAEQIGKILNAEVDAENFAKIKETKHQKELTFEGRQKNLEGAFKVLDGKKLKGKRVLLVDDVITTGATANECALTLKKYAKSVYVITFARSVYKNLEK